MFCFVGGIYPRIQNALIPQINMWNGLNFSLVSSALAECLRINRKQRFPKFAAFAQGWTKTPQTFFTSGIALY